MRYRIFLAVFACLLAVLTVSTLAAPKKDFSQNENRTLAAFPEVTWESIRSGEFTRGVSEYLADHFILRDMWVSVKAETELALQKRYNNGVYKASDGSLIDAFEADSADRFEENLNTLSAFERDIAAAYGIETKIIIAPNSAQINEDKLPRFAINEDGRAMLARISDTLDGYIDVCRALDDHSSEYLYFRTDHHWTYLGAYYAYAEYKQALGEPVTPLEDMEPEYVAGDFFGTTYSRFGLFDKKHGDDIYAPSAAYTRVVSCERDGNETSSVYFPEMLDKKDKYQYYLAGNNATVRVKTDNENGRVLLLIKDSYANSFLPYIAPDYEKIVVEDLRYSYDCMTDVIEDEGVTDVLVLYNLESFAGDEFIKYLNE